MAGQLRLVLALADFGYGCPPHEKEEEESD